MVLVFCMILLDHATKGSSNMGRSPSRFATILSSSSMATGSGSEVIMVLVCHVIWQDQIRLV